MDQRHIRLLVVWCFGLVLAGAAAAPVWANDHAVEYRLTKWKNVHFHDTKKASVFFDTLKKLGCEVKQSSHDDCIDVTYRCLNWRRLALPDHDAIHGWEKWLKANGFQTKHSH